MTEEKSENHVDHSNTISVVIPTYNSELVIGDCLQSIKEQSLTPFEIIVSDGGSTDRTVDIAESYGAMIIKTGANRSAQRNAGAEFASGNYLVFVDSDMRLQRYVLAECVSVMIGDSVSAVVIHEIFVGDGYWAKVRGFERSFYDGVWYLEAARFYRRKQFINIGGFDVRLVGPEDWDLDERIRSFGSIKRTNSPILHYEGKTTLTSVLRKKAHYSDSFPLFKEIHPRRAELSLSPMKRAGLFWASGGKLVRHPILSAGVAILGLAEVMVSRHFFGRNLKMSYSHERAVE